MSENTDRRIGHNPLLLGAVVMLIVVVVAAGIMLWFRMGSPDATPAQTTESQTSLAQFAHRDEPLMVTLCYPLDGAIACGSAAVKRKPDTQSQAREVLMALFGDQRAAEAAGIRDVKVRALYVDASGKATVDLALLQQKEVRASAWEEHLAMYAIVNTVMQNFDDIKQVRFLRDGKEAQTLAGHMDLSRTFTKRMDLVKQ
jgi:hypothetical protein